MRKLSLTFYVNPHTKFQSLFLLKNNNNKKKYLKMPSAAALIGTLKLMVYIYEI